MVKQIDYQTALNEYIDIIGEIEFGNHFDRTNDDHKKILNERLEHYNQSNILFFSAYDDESHDPCGIISIVENQNIFHTDDCEILQIGVKNAYRKQGIGSQLLNFITDYYKKKDYYCIFVNTYAADYKVISFYGKNGFYPISVIPDTNGKSDEGTIVMRKKLM